MEVAWKKVLKDSISEAFSTMYFMVPEEVPNLLDEQGDDFSGVWYQGELSATHPKLKVLVWTWSPLDLARELTANILSCEPDEVAATDILDAYGELLNIVLGSVLTAIDTKSEWQLGLPKTRELNATDLGEALAEAHGHLFFDMEGMPFICGWRSFKAR